MKKFITVCFMALAAVCLFGTSNAAEAQPVVVSNRCCDAWDVVRCYQVNYTPVGNLCFCSGQGYGHTC